jgi:hypothetical protein
MMGLNQSIGRVATAGKEKRREVGTAQVWYAITA